VLVAGSGLILLMPLLALLGLAVLLESGRPMLFWQQRIGVDGRSFSLCKFRSMRPVPVVESQTTWTDTSRISTVGRFLRASSLDEVPQLWNVLRGDMSLVGPRPERPTFVERFSHEHERYWARHRVPVGLTGLAQVNGLRGDTSIADRALFDNYYIANWSLWLDVKIVLLTAREVLRGSGG
jgi:lipopolysaccharide/colanic/teichoic acid biosynthesis glycosyltransferase